jgi:hypothetical protein
MADDDVQPNSRSDRLARRRRRVRWAVILLVAAIVGGAGTVAAFTLTGDDATSQAAPQPHAEHPDKSFKDEKDLPELSQINSDTIVTRPLSHDDPLRLWVGGDSLSGATGMALGALTAPTGIVKTQVDYKVSSGLTNRIRDWQPYAKTAMTKNDPEVVVFMVGANDTKIVNSQDRDGDGIPDWQPEYRAKVDAMMDILVGDSPKRLVLWIGSPTLRDTTENRGAQQLDTIMREEAAKRKPDVLYVDAYRLFSDINGGYTDTLTNADGKRVRVRVGDGVHVTPAGAEYLANAVFALLDARWHINEQSDPAHRIGYEIMHGTGEGSGSSRSGSGSGSSHRATTTTPRTGGSSTSTPETVDEPTTVDPTQETTVPTTGATTPTSVLPTLPTTPTTA